MGHNVKKFRETMRKRRTPTKSTVLVLGASALSLTFGEALNFFFFPLPLLFYTSYAVREGTFYQPLLPFKLHSCIDLRLSITKVTSSCFSTPSQSTMSAVPGPVYGLEVPPGEVLIPASMDFPASVSTNLMSGWHPAALPRVLSQRHLDVCYPQFASTS